MGHTTLRLTLLAAGLMYLLGAADPAWAPPPPPCPNTSMDLFLHKAPAGNLLLVETAPGGASASFTDSPGLTLAGGWREIGTWEIDTGEFAGDCVLSGVSDLHVWLGLKTSDDQGTRFDLKAEVFSNDLEVGSGQVDCIKGVTRNPAKAKAVTVPLALTVADASFEGDLGLRISARIATPASNCPGHASAAGVRLYYGAASRDSRFDVEAFERPEVPE